MLSVKETRIEKKEKHFSGESKRCVFNPPNAFMQYGDACASVGSEPIGGSRGNRHGIWLSRTLDATRPRSLALDGNERSRGELPSQPKEPESLRRSTRAPRIVKAIAERALTAITSRLYSASTVPCNAEKATGGVNQSGTRTYRPDNDSIPIPFFSFSGFSSGPSSAPPIRYRYDRPVGNGAW